MLSATSPSKPRRRCEKVWLPAAVDLDEGAVVADERVDS